MQFSSMIEQIESTLSSVYGTVKKRHLLLKGLACVLGLLLLARKESDATGNPLERVRQLRQTQEIDSLTEEEQVINGRAGGVDFKFDVDKDTLFAGVALGIGSAVAAITSVTGGAALAWFDKHVQVIPSRIEYVFPSTITLRELSFTEQTGLQDATERFYSDILIQAHPDAVKEVRLESDKKVHMTTSSGFFDDVFDWITGKTRIYGYEWKFTAFVRVDDSKNLTVGDILVTMTHANMATYVTNYLVPLKVTSNIMSNTQTATYFDRL